MNAPFSRTLGGEESPSPLQGSVAPVKRGDRIASLDVLRGFALLGILVANIEGFAGLEGRFEIPIGVAKNAFVGPHTHLNLVILFLKWIFIEDKMRGLFAMLFGAGVVLLTERIERNNGQVNSADIFLRRNMWLFVFGVLHGTFIWDGDILAEYAFNALFFLYPCRKLKAKSLFVVGTIVWIGIGTLASSVAEGDFEYLRLSRQKSALVAIEKSGTNLTPAQNETKKEWRALITKNELRSTDEANANAAKRRNGGYIGYVKDRGTGFVRHLGDFESGYYFADILGAMLIGMALYKSGFLISKLPLSTYLSTAFVGFLISTPLYVVGIWKAYGSSFYFAVIEKWIVFPHNLTAEAGTLANAALLMILFKGRVPRTLLRPFAAVGQTALTNYLLTSVLCQYLFVFGPLELYGRVEYYQSLYFVLAVWVVNLVASSLWLRHFEFGPVEWLWRSLTYWKLQPMRLRSK
ncbi:DUF418 domain-containing protein [Acidisarcina polymorpha]|uniref:DUF418 domain-containing protein n=1 Tax=Acidisarcina polymorpha TaxID=2211140 RepID=UPI0013751170|nr:DUF418 domain-containing protein [Acidisarcina polymorpha]